MNWIALLLWMVAHLQKYNKISITFWTVCTDFRFSHMDLHKDYLQSACLCGEDGMDDMRSL